MIALDTNVLVRFVVGDDETQAARVYKLFKAAEKDLTQFYVSAQVSLELVWVLQAVYEFRRSDILDAFESLAALPILKFYSSDEIKAFVRTAAKSRLDLADLLIGLSSKNQKCTHTLTFDKRAAKSDLFKLLK